MRGHHGEHPGDDGPPAPRDSAPGPKAGVEDGDLPGGLGFNGIFEAWIGVFREGMRVS